MTSLSLVIRKIFTNEGNSEFKKIKDKLIKFSKERDWEKFHTPKNLATALTVEVSELLEIFQWSLDGGQDVIENSKEEIESEIADIFNYLVKLVDLLDIDLEKIALKKIDLNSKKYPIEKSKGKSVKYTEL